jgi:4-amino-4-deoxy-L-arabinose transferase-like glycosyltransferase
MVSQGPEWVERGRFVPRLMAICAVALVLRVVAVALVPTQPVSDYWSYLRRAENLLETGTYGVRAGRPDATWPPGYPIALAGALAVSGRSLLAAKGLNVLLGVAAVGFAGLAGRRLGGHRVGLAAAGIAAVVPRLVLMPCILASENLFLPLLMLWMLILAGSWQNPGLRRALAGGVVLGLATLARVAGYLLGFTWALAGLLARRPLRRVAAETLLVLAAQYAVMLPWALRNRESMDGFSFLTTSAGMTLYMGNNPHATGRWYRAEREFGEVARRHGESGRVTGFERDRLFRREALRWMREEPAAAAKLYARKLALVLRGETIAEMVATAEGEVPRHALPRGAPRTVVRALPEEHALRRDPRWLAWPSEIGYWLLSALELGGCALLVAWGWGRRARDRREHWRAAAAAFLGTAIYLVALGALFHGDPRFRWPASDVLIPVAGLCAVELARRAGVLGGQSSSRQVAAGEGVIPSAARVPSGAERRADPSLCSRRHTTGLPRRFEAGGCAGGL